MPDDDSLRNNFGKARNSFCKEYSGKTRDGRPCRSESVLAESITDGYVELVGPTRPRTLELIDERSSDARMPVHEYFWSMGVTGDKADWYQQLADADSIVVQLIFHVSQSPYVVQEVAANLNQIPPYQTGKKTTIQQIQGVMESARPLAETAGKLMELGGLTIPGKMLSAISHMKLNAVPTDQFPWFVKTFSWGKESGVEWHIPKFLIDCTGNRLVGSLGVSFLECDIPAAQGEVPKEFPLELRAFLRSSDGNELFLSPTDRSTALVIKPA